MTIFRIFILIVFTLQLSTTSAQQVDEYSCVKTTQLYHTIINYHINEHINSAILNERVANELIQGLDYYGVFFTKGDIKYIKDKQHTITLELILGSCAYANSIFDLYKEKVTFFDSVLRADEMWENDFTEPDSILLFGSLNKMEYVDSETQLIKKIRKRIKYLTLIDYQTSLDSVPGSYADFASKKISLTANIREMEGCRISQLLESDSALIESFLDIYLKAIASSFDPHTNYMSQKEMNEFEFSLSEEIFSTGLIIDEIRNGVYIIAGKVPGSASADMDEITEGDEILKVDYNDQDLHPACIGPAELMNLLNNRLPEEISLSLKKQNGSIVKVNIKKSMIENISNEIGSLILEDSIKVGYLSLPSFYRSMDDPKSNSSQDIATQINKFKEYNIDGLILDLRFNGGGSVHEAVELAGLFVNKGPLIQEISRNDRTVIKDSKKGALYDGHLIVLVNTMSASASEMLVSMLKEHDRAIIVGNKTYGKASGQLMGPLAYPMTNQEFGALKLTVLRYYDLDGNTFQKFGITPDIMIPDGFPPTLFSESIYEYSLENNKLNKHVKVKSKFAPIPLAALKIKNDNRLADNPIYHEIQLFSDSIANVMKHSKTLPLTVEDFVKATRVSPYDSAKYDYVINENFHVEVISGLTQFGTHTEDELIYAIGSDPTLREAMNIMRDWKTLLENH
ncbi:MAG: carboxyl-terminal processing protease [Cyclobacteriaceae bacterium]